MRRAYWNLLGMAVLAAGFVAAGCGDDESAEDSLECGPNTTLEDGYCVPEERCDEGEIVTPRGRCESEDIFCGEGAIYDVEREKCFSQSDVRCGEGTIEEDGRCVVEDPLHCSDETVLVDGTCELSEEVCGEGAELDGLHCHPTEDACEGYAEWDVATGECVDLRDVTCGETTVEQDNACVPLATFLDELAADADIDYSDGEPIVPSEDDQFVFTGTMDNGLTHSFEFEGTEGQWLEIKVYSRGLPSPGFDFEDTTSSWIRSTVAGMESVPERTVLTPADGTFEFSVVTHLSDSDDAGAFGDDGWRYVGTVDVVEAPDAYEWDYSQEYLDGDLTLTDFNFVEIDVDDTTEVIFEAQQIGEDAEDATLEVWESPEIFAERHDLESGEEFSVDAEGVSTLYFHVDASAFYGPETDFEISAMITETLETGQSSSQEIYAEEGEIIFLSHENNQTQAMAARVFFDGELQYQLDEVLAGNQTSYLATETNREFFYVAEDGEYLVEFENSSSSTVTGFLSTTYTDKKPTLEIDGPQLQQVDDTLDGDGAGYGDWKFAVVTTPMPALVEAAIDISSGTVPNARVYNSERELIKSVTNSFGTTEIDFMVEEPGAYFVVVEPGFTEISGDIEISMEGWGIDILEPGEVYEETFDAEAFDILHGHIGYEKGDHVDVRFINPHGTMVFEQTELSISGQWSIMELFPGPGEFTLQVENTGSSSLVGFEADVDVSTSFDSLTLEEEEEYVYERGAIDEGDSEFLIVQSPDVFSMTIEALMGLDQEGALRVWDIETGELVAEYEDMLAVETAAFTQAGQNYAVEFEAITDIEEDYELTLYAEESSIFEVDESSYPNGSIGEFGTEDTITISACPNVKEINMDIDLTEDWPSELIIHLEDPGGDKRVLKDGSSSTTGISGNLNETLDPLGSGEPIDVFEGTNGTGTWTLDIENTYWASGDMPGTLHSWGLNLTCEG